MILLGKESCFRGTLKSWKYVDVAQKFMNLLAIGCHHIHFSRLRVSGHLFEQFTTQKAKLLKIHSDFSNFLSPKKVFLLFPKPFPILSWIKKFFNFFKRNRNWKLCLAINLELPKPFYFFRKLKKNKSNLEWILLFPTLPFSELHTSLQLLQKE